ncbi:MAG: hypothetical protein J6B55_04480, partial [Clostridia bacterium]|nr:hypothetical protein [Clostridia bacterium]
SEERGKTSAFEMVFPFPQSCRLILSAIWGTFFKKFLCVFLVKFLEFQEPFLKKVLGGFQRQSLWWF